MGLVGRAGLSWAGPTNWWAGPWQASHGTHLLTSSLKLRSQPFPCLLTVPYVPYPPSSLSLLLGTRVRGATSPPCTTHSPQLIRPVLKSRPCTNTPVKLQGDHATTHQGSKVFQHCTFTYFFRQFPRPFLPFPPSLFPSSFYFSLYYYHTRISYVHFRPQPTP